MSNEVLRLYDRHASVLFALALRITGSEAAAAEVLTNVFASARSDDELPSLVRKTRELSLARYDRSPSPPVDRMRDTPSPRRLVDEAFYGGLSVDELAKRHSLDEAEVRRMLRDGMAGLRSQLADKR